MTNTVHTENTTSTVTPLVELKNLGKAIPGSRGQRPLWSGINLKVFAGEVVVIQGASGAGKSTLLNCIGQLDTVDTGEIWLNGTETAAAGSRQRARLRHDVLGYLFQDYALIDNETAAHNVALAVPKGNKIFSRSRDVARTVEESLAVVGLAGREKDRVYHMSGGEQQRVAMARILARNPAVILADEPTASLDRDNAEMILGLLRNAADAGAAVVIVSHDPWVVEHCDRSFSLHHTHEPAKS